MFKFLISHLKCCFMIIYEKKIKIFSCWIFLSCVVETSPALKNSWLCPWYSKHKRSSYSLWYSNSNIHRSSPWNIEFNFCTNPQCLCLTNPVTMFNLSLTFPFQNVKHICQENMLKVIPNRIISMAVSASKYQFQKVIKRMTHVAHFVPHPYPI